MIGVECAKSRIDRHARWNVPHKWMCSCAEKDVGTRLQFLGQRWCDGEKDALTPPSNTHSPSHNLCCNLCYFSYIYFILFFVALVRLYTTEELRKWYKDIYNLPIFHTDLLLPLIISQITRISSIKAMDTKGKSNVEFRSEVMETLARHESGFDQVGTTLQAVHTELQALRASWILPKVNPFAREEHPHTSWTPTEPPRSHLKLSFPMFAGQDPTGWIYKGEQYFEFTRTILEKCVHLGSFHLEGIALQWHRWLTKFRGPLTWEEFTKAVQLRSSAC